MIDIRWPWLWLYVGRDFVRQHPLTVDIVLFPRPDVTPYGETVRCFRAFEVTVSFDPELWFVPALPGRHNSITWTGREPGEWRLRSWWRRG